MYSAVPTNPPAEVNRVLPNSRAMPKSASFRSPSVGEQQIGRLQVAVDHAVVVGMLQRAGQLDAEPGRFAPIEAAAGLQLVFEIRAVDQLHGVEDTPCLFAEAVEPDDIRVLELLERFDFDFEPLAKALFHGQVGIENFDGRRLARFDY